MLTRNGKAYLFPTRAVYDGNTTNPQLFLRNTTGGTYNVTPEYMNDFRVIGGSGDTPASVDDYHLDSEVTTLDVTNNSATQKSGRSFEDNYIATFATTYQNNTGADVIIRELGLQFRSGTSTNQYMLARQVIEPTVVRAGRSYTFTMTIG